MGRRGLTGADEQRRCVAILWSRQVDAAALVGADGMRGGGSGARALGCREEEDDGKGRVREDPVGLIYKGWLMSGREK